MTQQRRPRCAIALSSAIFSAVVGAACSTIPGVPDRMSVATVSDVNQAETRIRDEMKSDVQKLVDDLMADDRARVKQLGGLLEEQTTTLQALKTRVDTAAQQLEAASTDRVELREALGNSLETLTLVSGSLERFIAESRNRMAGLPAETLREFSAALDAHLDAMEQRAQAQSATRLGAR